MSIVEHIRNGTGISSLINEREDLLDAVRSISDEAADLLLASTVAAGQKKKAVLRDLAAKALEVVCES